MSTTETELDYLEWLKLVNQKLTLAILKISDHTDISEEDYELLRVQHKLWYNGEYPLYRQKGIVSEETAVQTGLFAPDVAEKPAKDTKA